MLAALATGAVDKIKDDQATAEPDGRFLSIFISIYSWCSGKNNDNLVIKKNFCSRIFTDHLLVFPIVLLSARRLSLRTRRRRWSPPWALSIRPSSTTTLGRSAMSDMSVSLCLHRILHKIQSEVNKGYPEIYQNVSCVEVERLIQEDFPLDERDAHSLTPLHLAVSLGREEE